MGHPPWASTVNYVPFPVDPASPSLRRVWYTMRAARHSRDIEAHPAIAAAIFRTDLGDASPI